MGPLTSLPAPVLVLAVAVLVKRTADHFGKSHGAKAAVGGCPGQGLEGRVEVLAVLEPRSGRRHAAPVQEHKQVLLQRKALPLAVLHGRDA